MFFLSSIILTDFNPGKGTFGRPYDSTQGFTTKEQLILLKDALTRHATALAGTSKESAKEWLELGMEYFPDDKEYKLTYDTIVG